MEWIEIEWMSYKMVSHQNHQNEHRVISRVMPRLCFRNFVFLLFTHCRCLFLVLRAFPLFSSVFVLCLFDFTVVFVLRPRSLVYFWCLNEKRSTQLKRNKSAPETICFFIFVSTFQIERVSFVWIFWSTIEQNPRCKTIIFKIFFRIRT